MTFYEKFKVNITLAATERVNCNHNVHESKWIKKHEELKKHDFCQHTIRVLGQSHDHLLKIVEGGFPKYLLKAELSL